MTLFAPVGIAEDLSKDQYLLCGEIKEELKALRQSIAEIPFQELSKQVQDLSKKFGDQNVFFGTYLQDSEGHFTKDDQTTVTIGFISSGEMEPF